MASDRNNNGAGAEGGRSLREAQQLCATYIAEMEARVTGNLDRAVLEAELDDGESNPVPVVHTALLRYYMLFEPTLVAQATDCWTGEAYDEAIATVEVPKLHGVAEGYARTESVPISGLADLADWSLRETEIAGHRGTSRVYLSPAAIQACYRKLLLLQDQLEMHIKSRGQSIHQPTHSPNSEL